LAIAVRNRKSSRRFTNLSARIVGNDEYIILSSENSLYTGMTTDLNAASASTPNFAAPGVFEAGNQHGWCIRRGEIQGVQLPVESWSSRR